MEYQQPTGVPRSWPQLTAVIVGLFAALGISSPTSAQTSLVVSANVQRAIGGVGVLDRAKYFNYSGTLQGPTNTNLGNLRQQAWSPDGLNAAPGRVATELDAFISSNVTSNPEDAEDPSRPGFFDHAALINKIQQGNQPDERDSYRAFVTGKKFNGNSFPSNLSWVGGRWESLRQQHELSQTNPKVASPIFIQSGRNGGFWPDFLDSGTDMPTNYEAYADFLNVYLEEVVYGTGPNQGFLPIDKDRFYLEVMNEPNWPSPTQSQWDEVIEMHQVVTEQVKEVFPQAKIGGPSCCDDLGSGTNGWDRSRQLMDDMANWQTPSGQSVELDFWTIHPYERYDVAPNGTYSQRIFGSPGHVSGIMDLYESYSHQKFGDPKAFAITEYGSWNRTDMADGSFGDYEKPEQQWDLVRNIREKMMVFMGRPDRIINATPFVSPKDWRSDVPTHPEGDNVFWEQDAAGDWHETIVAGLFRMMNDVSGKYVPVDSDNPDLQSFAFRDGNQLYVILNNLEKSDNLLNLQALAGSNSVTSASLDRIFWDGSSGVYESGLDVTATWQNLTLASEEGGVLTLTLDGPELYDLVTDERTFYGDAVESALDSLGKSQIINILADTEDALFAQARVTFNREDQSPGESFFVVVNDNFIQVPAGVLNFDDNDTDIVTRTIDVPLNFLVHGNNEVSVDFVGSGGTLVTAVLNVTRAIGDYNGSGAFDGEDLSLLVAQFGAAGPDSRFDLTADGAIDMADVEHWLTELRGTSVGLGDFDLDDDIDADDLALWKLSEGGPSHYGLGDIDFDGDSDGADFLALQRLLAAQSSLPSSAASLVPEAESVLLMLAGLSIAIVSEASRYLSRQAISWVVVSRRSVRKCR
ncbi:MAG: hypothetical protein AAGD11_09230 [Planctomycetota bacterium]